MEVIKKTYSRLAYQALVSEVNLLKVKEVGQEGSLLWMKLQDGLKFYGYETSSYDKKIYDYLEKKLRVDKEFFGIASDIVTRYIYPQGSTVFPPYCRFQRLAFSQHAGHSLLDAHVSSKELRSLFCLLSIKKGDTILDVGAYNGYGSLGYRRLGAGRVISFECEAKMLDVIKANLKANGETGVEVIDKAAWSSCGIGVLGDAYEFQASSLVYGLALGKSINTTTIDSVVEERVDYISMTINGAELEALKGAENTLDKWSPRLSITGWIRINNKPLWKKIVPWLQSKKYNTLRIGRGRVFAWKD